MEHETLLFNVTCVAKSSIHPNGAWHFTTTVGKLLGKFEHIRVWEKKNEVLGKLKMNVSC